MINSWYKEFVNELSYGTECVVLDRSTIRQFIDWKKFLCENTKANRINGISDEGLYDFFQGFDDYKRVVDYKAKQIIWPRKIQLANIFMKLKKYTGAMVGKKGREGGGASLLCNG